MRKLLPLLAALTVFGCSSESQEPAVWAAGSSTVFPFASRVAENMARKTGRPAPRVESLGTGGGIKAFCDGAGPGTPDIAMASRQMKPGEWDDCRKAGVAVAELRVGADGVVVATDRQGADYQLTLEQLYEALADELPTANGGFAPNGHRTWAEVDPALPPIRIQVYGPPPTSGTRDAFVELAMDAGAEELPVMAALKERDEDAFQARARTLREDGGWIDSGENDNALLQTLTRTPGALGVFGFSFLGQNRDRVKAAAINGVPPTTAAISSGDYPLARTLYLYVKKNSLERTPGLRPYLAEFLSEAASGKGGYLVDQGMIPLPQTELLASRQLVTNLPDMPRPE
jgi:phosphate transport system substrate-binding protein